MIEQYFGEIRMFAGETLPSGWMPCDGAILTIEDYQPLYAVIGSAYGGDGITTFALPDMRARFPLAPASDAIRLGSKLPASQETAPVNADNTQPYLALNFGIAVKGLVQPSEY